MKSDNIYTRSIRIVEAMICQMVMFGCESCTLSEWRKNNLFQNTTNCNPNTYFEETAILFFTTFNCRTMNCMKNQNQLMYSGQVDEELQKWLLLAKLRDVDSEVNEKNTAGSRDHWNICGIVQIALGTNQEKGY